MTRILNNFVICAAILILAFGLFLKWNSVVEAHSRQVPNSLVIDPLPLEFEAPMQMKITTNNSRYVIRIRHRQCDGSLFLLQINRNSEDAALLSRWHLDPNFILENQIYPEFPTVKFWIQRALSKITMKNGLGPVVTAIAEIGDCGMKPLFLTVMQIAATGAN